jgi:hypothetical protein
VAIDTLPSPLLAIRYRNLLTLRGGWREQVSGRYRFALGFDLGWCLGRGGFLAGDGVFERFDGDSFDFWADVHVQFVLVAYGF